MSNESVGLLLACSQWFPGSGQRWLWDRKMKNEHTLILPDYLAELLQPTPGGVAKLIAAWDGLSTESKMILLAALDRANFPGHLAERVLSKALESESAYVRYLAVGRLYSGDEETTVKKRIEEDPEPLVRYSLIENRETPSWLGTHSSKTVKRLSSMRLCKTQRSFLVYPRRHVWPMLAVWGDRVKS